MALKYLGNEMGTIFVSSNIYWYNYQRIFKRLIWYGFNAENISKQENRFIQLIKFKFSLWWAVVRQSCSVIHHCLVCCSLGLFYVVHTDIKLKVSECFNGVTLICYWDKVIKTSAYSLLIKSM